RRMGRLLKYLFSGRPGHAGTRLAVFLTGCSWQLCKPLCSLGIRTVRDPVFLPLIHNPSTTYSGWECGQAQSLGKEAGTRKRGQKKIFNRAETATWELFLHKE